MGTAQSSKATASDLRTLGRSHDPSVVEGTPMTRQQAAWLKKPDPDPLFDRSREKQPYVHANILGPSANRSRRRINYTTIFCAFVLFLWILEMIF
jgi:hypothetical protein